MFSLIAFTSILPFVSAYCGDDIFFEKNKITEYTKISSRSSRMRSGSLLPALEWVQDLEKMGLVLILIKGLNQKTWVAF